MVGEHEDEIVKSWSGLLERGQLTSEEALQQRTASLDPEGVCEPIYMSGTTGAPKGVMLTHRNIIWVAEQVITLYNPIFTGACTWFAESLDKLGENLRPVRDHQAVCRATRGVLGRGWRADPDDEARAPGDQPEIRCRDREPLRLDGEITRPRG